MEVGERGGELAAHGYVYTYLLNMSDTISTSVSAAAIFSAEESWGRPPKRKDIVSCTVGGLCADTVREGSSTKESRRKLPNSNSWHCQGS